MSYKMVVTDMDGTLLNSKNEISEFNLKVISELKKLGIIFIVATGRLDTMVKEYLRIIENQHPVISCNGALVRNAQRNEFYEEKLINKIDYLKVFDICHYYKTHFNVYCENTIYSETWNERIEHFVKYNKTLPQKEKISISVVDNLASEIANEKVFKVLIHNSNHNILEEIKEEINKNESLEAIKSSKNLLDVMKDSVSKGNAVKTLAERLKINSSEIIAMGDNHNDLSMLDFAGYAIAMGNAEPCVKEVADYVTFSNDEDGVAEALTKVFNLNIKREYFN